MKSVALPSKPSGMSIQMLPPSALKPYSNNPRHNEQAVAAVRKSLDEFGWRQPIVVDNKNVIVVGHTRWLAAKQRGDKLVPVHVATDLSPLKIKAYRLADNKVGELAEWDDDKLMSELAALMQEDVDLKGFGFTDEDLGLIDTAEKEALKQDRWEQDFDVMPMPKPQWILIKAPGDTAAELVSEIRARQLPMVKVAYSGEAPQNKQ